MADETRGEEVRCLAGDAEGEHELPLVLQEHLPCQPYWCILEAVISQRTCVQEFYLQLKRLLVITRGSKLTSLEHFWELTSVEN